MTPEQVLAFVEEYHALCKKHGTHLASDQDYNVVPVVNDLCLNLHDRKWAIVRNVLKRASGC